VVKVEIKHGSQEELLQAFSQSVHEAWQDVSKQVEAQFRKCLEQVLLPRVEAWDVSEEVVKKYPFLKEKRRFVESYINCFSVDVSEMSVSFFLDEGKVARNSFPKEIGELLEFGSLDFPSLPHFRNVVDSWRTLCETQFLQDLIGESTDRYGDRI